MEDVRTTRLLEKLEQLQKKNEQLRESNQDMLSTLQYIISVVNPKDYCRGKFPFLEGGQNRAYVGSKTMLDDEAILRAIESIKKATK